MPELRTCTCDHAERRHLEGEGLCNVAGCICSGFVEVGAGEVQPPWQGMPVFLDEISRFNNPEAVAAVDEIFGDSPQTMAEAERPAKVLPVRTMLNEAYEVVDVELVDYGPTTKPLPHLADGAHTVAEVAAEIEVGIIMEKAETFAETAEKNRSAGERAKKEFVGDRQVRARARTRATAELVRIYPETFAQLYEAAKVAAAEEQIALGGALLRPGRRLPGETALERIAEAPPARYAARRPKSRRSE